MTFSVHWSAFKKNYKYFNFLKFKVAKQELEKLQKSVVLQSQQAVSSARLMFLKMDF